MVEPLEAAAKRLLDYMGYLGRDDDVRAVARALLAREQSVADAYRRGQEDMRERAAEFSVARLKEYDAQGSLDIPYGLLNTLRSAIRALPIKEQP